MVEPEEREMLEAEEWVVYKVRTSDGEEKIGAESRADWDDWLCFCNGQHLSAEDLLGVKGIALLVTGLTEELALKMEAMANGD